LLCQLDHDGFGHVDSVEECKVPPDCGRVDDEPFNDHGHQPEAVVGEDGSLGKEHPFAGGVGQVPLVPERVVLERGFYSRTDDPGKPADLFALDRVPLVGHGGGAHLLCPKRFLDFPDLGPLEGADLDPYLVERGRDTGAKHEVLRVPVPGDHLVRHVHRIDTKVCHHRNLHFHRHRPERCLCPDGAGHLPHYDPGAHLFEALDMSCNFACPYREPEPVRGRDALLPVGPAYADEVLGLFGSLQEHSEQFPEFCVDQIERLAELESGCCIEDIVACRTVMDPPARLPADFRDRFHDRHHVMTDLKLDRLCPVERGVVCVRIDLDRCCCRDHAVMGFGFCQRDFSADYCGEPVCLAPDGTHLFCAIALLDGVDCHG